MDEEMLMEHVTRLGRNAEAAMTALQTVIEEAKALADLLSDAAESPTPETCTHPIGARQDVSTSGWRKWFCPICKYVHEERISRDETEGGQSDG